MPPTPLVNQQQDHFIKLCQYITQEMWIKDIFLALHVEIKIPFHINYSAQYVVSGTWSNQSKSTYQKMCSKIEQIGFSSKRREPEMEGDSLEFIT